MLIDALTLPEDTLIEKDICIVGAGAAGITLARELIDQPYQVCLLENRAEIEQARNLTTLFHANVVEIETNDTAQTVTRLRVASLDGKKFWEQQKYLF